MAAQNFNCASKLEPKTPKMERGYSAANSVFFAWKFRDKKKILHRLKLRGGIAVILLPWCHFICHVILTVVVPLIFRLSYTNYCNFHEKQGKRDPIREIVVRKRIWWTGKLWVTGRCHLHSVQDGPFDVPRSQMVFGSRPFSTAGPQAWNQLPSDICNSATYSTFKHDLKTFLFIIVYRF